MIKKTSCVYLLENVKKIRIFGIKIPEVKKIHLADFFLLGNGCACTLCRDVVRSSAMSDTSEAPSLASHVRRVRVPSQASGTQNNSFFFPIYPMICSYIDEGMFREVFSFSGLGATGLRFCHKTQKGPAKSVYCVWCSLFPLWLKFVPGWPAISVSS
jgi:hypothetical protein